MNELYKKQVALLIRIMPLVYKIKDFAVHGGTAINLFHKNMPRYSVDIDVTYIPIQEREESLKTINAHLIELKKMIEKTIPGVRITHKPNVWKLLCVMDGATVKIEVNATKRGLVGGWKGRNRNLISYYSTTFPAERFSLFGVRASVRTGPFFRYSVREFARLGSGQIPPKYCNWE